MTTKTANSPLSPRNLINGIGIILILILILFCAKYAQVLVAIIGLALFFFNLFF